MNDITTRAREMTAALCAALEVAEAERDALRAEAERLRAELASVMGECARLRSDVDVEREQSAVFVKEIERLRVVEAGAAIMRRVLNEVGRYAEWASTVREALRDGAGNDFLIQLVSAECDLAHVRQELDAASAENERLRAEIEKERAEVERLRARKAEVCDCVHATGMIGESFIDVDDDCPKCGGAGAVFVEGQK